MEKQNENKPEAKPAEPAPIPQLAFYYPIGGKDRLALDCELFFDTVMGMSRSQNTAQNWINLTSWLYEQLAQPQQKTEAAK